MNGAFRVISTAAFEREFRKISRGDARLVQGLEELIAVLATDPHNRSGEHQIKKICRAKDRNRPMANSLARVSAPLRHRWKRSGAAFLPAPQRSLLAEATAETFYGGVRRN